MAPKETGDAKTRRNTATGGVLNHAIGTNCKARKAKFQVFVFQQMDDVLDEVLVLDKAILHAEYRAHVAAIASHVRAPPWIE